MGSASLSLPRYMYANVHIHNPLSVLPADKTLPEAQSSLTAHEKTVSVCICADFVCGQCCSCSVQPWADSDCCSDQCWGYLNHPRVYEGVLCWKGMLTDWQILKCAESINTRLSSVWERRGRARLCFLSGQQRPASRETARKRERARSRAYLCISWEGRRSFNHCEHATGFKILANLGFWFFGEYWNLKYYSHPTLKTHCRMNEISRKFSRSVKKGLGGEGESRYGASEVGNGCWNPRAV